VELVGVAAEAESKGASAVEQVRMTAWRLLLRVHAPHSESH
jgi:hypothetical protein